MRLVQRQRTTIKTVQVWIATGLLTVIAGIIIYLQLSNSEKAYAAASYYTNADGEYATTIWSNISNFDGVGCSCVPACNFSGPAMTIAHKLTSSSCSTLKFSGGTVVNVTGTAHLFIYTNFEVNGGSTLNIANNDSVIVNGNLVVSGGSNINVSGYFRVNGNVVMSGGSMVCGTGSATYSGTLSGSTWCTAVLPISLIYFNVQHTENEVQLSWSTASENNNDFFTIERSIDGKHFTQLLTIDGAGNSNNTLNYTATDLAPVNGINYYRLKQTDFNGHFEYFPVASVNLIAGQNEIDLHFNSIAPNPFTDNFTINYTVNQPGEAEIQLIKLGGEFAARKKIMAAKGFNTFSFNDIQNIPSGIYLVSIKINNQNLNKKILKN